MQHDHGNDIEGTATLATDTASSLGTPQAGQGDPGDTGDGLTQQQVRAVLGAVAAWMPGWTLDVCEDHASGRTDTSVYLSRRAWGERPMVVIWREAGRIKAGVYTSAEPDELASLGDYTNVVDAMDAARRWVDDWRCASFAPVAARRVARGRRQAGQG